MDSFKIVPAHSDERVLMQNIPATNSPLYDIQEELKEKGYFMMDCPFCDKRHRNELCEKGEKLLFSYVEKERIMMKSVLSSASLSSTRC